MGLALQCSTTFISVRVELVPRLKCVLIVVPNVVALVVDLGLNRVDDRSGAHRGKTSKETRNSSSSTVVKVWVFIFHSRDNQPSILK